MVQALYLAMQKEDRVSNLQELEFKGHIMTIDVKLKLFKIRLASLEMVVDALVLGIKDKDEQTMQGHGTVVTSEPAPKRDPVDMDTEEAKWLQGNGAVEDEEARTKLTLLNQYDFFVFPSMFYVLHNCLYLRCILVNL